MRAARAARRTALIVPLALATMTPRATAEEKCMTCHPASRVEFEQSVHARESLGCASCHGGDPESLDAEAAHRGRFEALADRQAIPASCARCHSDLAAMRPYNLPVDQYAVYQTSAHGRAVASGDLRGAVCSDCHGAHDTRPPSDPKSRVHQKNLPATCAACHSDASLMSGYGHPTDVVEAYVGGGHGRALLVEGVPAAPSCNSCHGVHGATPPGFGDIDKVCGSCHTEARRAFLEGAHYPALIEAELPECSSCHSSHGIRRLELAALDTLCAECHGEGSPEAAVGSKIYTLISTAEAEVDAAEALLDEAARVPLHIEDHLGRIEEARTYLTETQPLVHAVSVEPIEQVTRRARSIGQEIQHEVYPRLDDRTARIGLVLYWFYVLMTVAILVGHRRRLARSSKRS